MSSCPIPRVLLVWTMYVCLWVSGKLLLLYISSLGTESLGWTINYPRVLIVWRVKRSITIGKSHAGVTIGGVCLYDRAITIG